MKEVPGNITGVAVHLNAQIIETNPGEFSTTIGIETAEPILSVPTGH